MKKCLVIGGALLGCALAGVKLLNSVKKCRKDANDVDDMEIESSASYEAELAEIQTKHAAEMAALEEMDKRAEKEHQKRMAEMRARYMKNVEKMEEIRKELLKNVDIRKNSTPEEALKLEERDKELLKELSEIRM